MSSFFFFFASWTSHSVNYATDFPFRLMGCGFRRRFKHRIPIKICDKFRRTYPYSIVYVYCMAVCVNNLHNHGMVASFTDFIIMALTVSNLYVWMLRAMSTFLFISSLANNIWKKSFYNEHLVCSRASAWPSCESTCNWYISQSFYLEDTLKRLCQVSS